MILFTIVEILIISYFVYVVLYTLIFSFAGLFYRQIKFPIAPKNLRFAVLIPSYKEDGVILDVARRALDQHYPKEYYDVVVIADSLQPETIKILNNLPLKVIEVNFTSSTKVKSLNFALSNLNTPYDCAVILDADNVMLPDFLQKMNNAHQAGFHVIQGQRLPKNTNSSLSFLDGLSEAINTHIYRKGTVALGLSSSISGSGISFNFKKLKELLSGMDSIGGFDRELELKLLDTGVKVYYYHDANVLDEKVSKTEVFENQRKRWISSQYHYLGKYFSKGVAALLKGNFTYFNSSVLRNIQLPRLINIGLLSTLTILVYFVRDYLYINYLWLPFLLCVFGFSIAISIPLEFYNRKLFESIIKLPLLFIKMFLLLFKLKGANKKFIHTPHYNIDVELDNPKK